MTNERRFKLLKYLFPNEKIRYFMCNQLYGELSTIIPKNMCISYKNKKNDIRKKNLNTIKTLIWNYFDTHPIYKLKIENFYNVHNKHDILNIVIISYVFNEVHEIRMHDIIDIFLNKESVCYSPISIIDTL